MAAVITQTWRDALPTIPNGPSAKSLRHKNFLIDNALDPVNTRVDIIPDAEVGGRRRVVLVHIEYFPQNNPIAPGITDWVGLRPTGIIAVTDWLHGPVPCSAEPNYYTQTLDIGFVRGVFGRGIAVQHSAAQNLRGNITYYLESATNNAAPP